MFLQSASECLIALNDGKCTWSKHASLCVSAINSNVQIGGENDGKSI